jgi:hypothetical protein
LTKLLNVRSELSQTLHVQSAAGGEPIALHALRSVDDPSETCGLELSTVIVGDLDHHSASHRARNLGHLLWRKALRPIRSATSVTHQIKRWLAIAADPNRMFATVAPED